MDLEFWVCWEDYIKVKEDMFECINIFEVFWFIVEGNDKK